MSWELKVSIKQEYETPIERHTNADKCGDDARRYKYEVVYEVFDEKTFSTIERLNSYKDTFYGYDHDYKIEIKEIVK